MSGHAVKINYSNILHDLCKVVEVVSWIFSLEKKSVWYWINSPEQKSLYEGEYYKWR